MTSYQKLREAHLSIACQDCGAEPGATCKAPTGEEIPKLHKGRVDAGNLIYIRGRKNDN